MTKYIFPKIMKFQFINNASDSMIQEIERNIVKTMQLIKDFILQFYGP